MGVGVVIYRNGEIFHQLAHNAGIGTSNIAEWLGCVLGVKAAFLLSKQEPWAEFYMYSDSQLIVNQFTGLYRIKDAKFRNYYNKAKKYEKGMGRTLGIWWVPREKNKAADKQSKIGVNLKEITLKI